MRNTLTVGDYLTHMRDSIEDIRRATAGLDLAAFSRDRTVQLAATKAIEITGEAARSLTRYFPEFAAAQHSIDWRKIIATRNRLTHGYFEIDYAIVWEVIHADIPNLAAALVALPPLE